VPLKGLHILLKALQIVKRIYPGVKLLVPGMAVSKDGKFLFVDGYAKYIKSLIRKLELDKNVIFLGRLECRQLIESMLKSHIAVIPSAIEGTSLILREAMFLGLPSIASFRGGMADFISDKKSGYLYDFPEFSYLANRILDLFKNDAIANGFSKEAIIQAKKAHNREENPRKLIEMYRSINGHE
jgi:glycosyltransferase involved in cell wall biosynthesis